MSKEYYQMGWTLDDTYQEDYFCSRDNQRYFIKKNTTPMIATLSAEGIVPRLRWTKRISNGDVLIYRGNSCEFLIQFEINYCRRAS